MFRIQENSYNGTSIADIRLGSKYTWHILFFNHTGQFWGFYLHYYFIYFCHNKYYCPQFFNSYHLKKLLQYFSKMWTNFEYFSTLTFFILVIWHFNTFSLYKFYTFDFYNMFNANFHSSCSAMFIKLICIIGIFIYFLINISITFQRIILIIFCFIVGCLFFLVIVLLCVFYCF